MSYEPSVWKDGDLISAEKLNKLENGVANNGGSLIIEVMFEGDPTNITGIDKSYNEIRDAMYVGKNIILTAASVELEATLALPFLQSADSTYICVLASFMDTAFFVATDPDVPMVIFDQEGQWDETPDSPTQPPADEELPSGSD